MRSIFVRVLKHPADAEMLIRFFAAHGVPVSLSEITIPKHYEGKGTAPAGSPRDFGFIAVDENRAEAALQIREALFEGTRFVIRPSTRNGEAPHAGASKFQPRGERFRPFTEEDFRGE
jgi:hypothetical protein